MGTRRWCIAGAVLLAIVVGTAGCQNGSASEDDWARVTATEWRLERLDEAPVLAGTRITLAFDPAGRLFGNAGANNYFASFERNGASGLSVSPVASTQMFLAEPAGLMEQEGRYLALLQGVDAFRLDGSRLELHTAGRSVLDLVSQGP